MAQHKNVELTIQSYDAIAKKYQEKTRPYHNKEEANYFLTQIPKNGTILDVGCGPGRDAKIFSEQGYQVTGIDLSKEMIRLARKAAPDAELEVMDLGDLAFENESFDGVWSCASFLHIPRANLDKAASESYRVLKPGGFAYVAVSGKRKKSDPDELILEDYGRPRFISNFNEGELEEYLRRAGFSAINSRVLPPNELVPVPMYRIFCKK